MDHPYSVSLFSTLFPGQITRLLTSLSNLLNAHMYSKKKSWTVKEKDVTFCVCMLSRFSCIWLWDTMDCSPPGSSVHGILQARILEWLPCPPPGDSPHPGTEPESLTSPVLAGRFFTTSATWEALWLRVDKEVMCGFYIFVGLLTFNMWRSAAFILVVKKLGDTLQILELKGQISVHWSCGKKLNLQWIEK